MLVRRTVFLLAFAVAVVATIGVSVAAAGGGNSANAKLCQKGGWESFQTDNGVVFADAEACTSYTANGGTLFSPALTPSFLGCFGFVNDGQIFYHADYAFTVSGFHPNTLVTVQLPGFPYPLSGARVTTDASGAAIVPVQIGFPPDAPAELDATDAAGVHASPVFTTASC